MADHIPGADNESGSGSSAGWVTHESFYVASGETPGMAASGFSEKELKRRRWTWWKAMWSWPLMGFIKTWRLLLSPLYGQVCAYYPSCSAYGLEAVTAHGPIRGAGLTTWRVLRCHPFTTGGVDHVPVSKLLWRQGKVPKIVVTNHPPMDPDFDPEAVAEPEK